MSKLFHFKIEHPNRVSEIVNPLGEDQGINHTGHFSWMGLEGTYDFHDHYLNLNITDKPRVVPWKIIESNLTKFLTNINVIS